MNGISSYTELQFRKRRNDQINQEIRRRQNPIEYVPQPLKIEEMQGYHLLLPGSPISEIDQRMPPISEWTPKQVSDFCVYILSVDDPLQLRALRSRMLRVAMQHAHIDDKEILHVLACATFQVMAKEEEADSPFTFLPDMPEKSVRLFSMIDVHAGIQAIQLNWHTMQFTRQAHGEVVCFLEHIASLVAFEYDPPNELCNHPGWMRDGKPSANFSMMCLSFLSNYLAAYNAFCSMPYKDVNVQLSSEEEACARKWLLAGMADPDVNNFFRSHCDEWMAAPGLFGMYCMNMPSFPYLKITTRTVKKSTCINQVFNGINILMKTPPSKWQETFEKQDPRWPMCVDSAFFCVLATILPQHSNVQIRNQIEVYDFFSPRQQASVTRIGGVFFFHKTQELVRGVLPALKYWLPTQDNGQQLCDNIFRNGLYRVV